MRQRTFDEMITYFNDQVAEMKIARIHKMMLLGMITAIAGKHWDDMLNCKQAEVAPVVRCKDCVHAPFPGEDNEGFLVEFPDEICPCHCDDGWYSWRPAPTFFCARGEVRKNNG